MNPSRLRAVALAAAVTSVLAACGGSPSSTAEPSTTPATAPTAEPSGASPSGPSPSPTATSSPEPSDTPDASPSASSAAGGGFAVTPNAEADRLFLTRDDCENRTDGYRLEFPDDWWTNTEIGKWPPCVWFSPTYYTVDELDEVPEEIAITIEYSTADRGSLEEVLQRDDVTIGGQPAVVVEYRGAEGSGGTKPPDWYEYVIQVQLGPSPEEGPNIVARTSTDMGGEYELNKAVLDRIMATITFVGSVQPQG